MHGIPVPATSRPIDDAGDGYISRTSAYLCAARGELPTRRFGRRVLVLVAPFFAMLGGESGRADETDERVGEEGAA